MENKDVALSVNPLEAWIFLDTECFPRSETSPVHHQKSERALDAESTSFLWPWARRFTSGCLSFPLCKMG